MKNIINHIKENKKTTAIIAGVSLVAGIMITPTGVSSEELNKVNDEKAALSKNVEELQSKITELQVKVAEAEPFFALKEEEKKAIEAEAKKAEEERLAKEKAEAEKLAKEEEERKKAELEAKSVTLGNGNYIAGEDFEPGVYDIVALSGGGNVISSNSFNGGINAIMGPQDDGFYEKEYKNIKLPKGTELKIDGVEIKLIPKQ